MVAFVQQRRRILMALITVVALMSWSLPGVADAASWKGFGSGSAVGRGTFGSPMVSIDSSTEKNPKQVRFTVSSTTTAERDVYVSWFLTCHKGYDYEYRSGSKTVKLSKSKPYTVTWKADKLPVKKREHCSLDVSAFHVKTGNLKVALQAVY